MSLPERIVARYKTAVGAPWLPDMVGSKAGLIDELLKAIKREQSDTSGFSSTPKAWAGGLFYFIVEAMSGKSVAQKLWNLLDSSAGLAAGDKQYQMARRAAGHLPGGPDGQIQAAGIGVALLQRTGQQNKAKQANAIMVEALKDALAQAGPVGEMVKPQTPAQDFAEKVKEQAAFASKIASKIKKDVKIAAPIVWLVLEDVNAHSESSVAESLLSGLSGEADYSTAQKFVGSISQHLDYGVVEAGAFGVALLEAVGEAGAARKLAVAMVKAFKKYLGAGVLFGA